MTVSEIQNSLFSQYRNKGFLSENEITDCCICNNLDFFETDEVMQFLIDKKVLFSEKKGEIIYEEEDIYDKAQIDYDEFFDTVLTEYPDFKIIVAHIKSIKPPQHREWKNLIYEAQSCRSSATGRQPRRPPPRPDPGQAPGHCAGSCGGDWPPVQRKRATSVPGEGQRTPGGTGSSPVRH